MRTPEDVLIAHGCEDFIVGGYSDLSVAMIEFAEEYHAEKNKDELTLLLDFLLKENYCDSDAVTEITAIDRYLHQELRDK